MPINNHTNAKAMTRDQRRIFRSCVCTSEHQNTYRTPTILALESHIAVGGQRNRVERRIHSRVIYINSELRSTVTASNHNVFIAVY